MYRYHGRAQVNPSSPRAFATCDRCGFLYNLDRLQWQFQWAGTQLQNLRLLVCDPCLDVPQEQLRAIIIPPDPVPVFNARPEPYFSDQTNFRITEDDSVRVTEDDSDRVTIERLGGDGNVDS